MKKNKLILLTILIVLAIYCGAVIFVTKPDSFAYDSLFRDIDVTVQVPSSEKAEAEARAERDALLADVEAIAQQKADEAGRNAVTEAVAISNDNLDKAIQAAVEKYDATISAMIDEAVTNAVADVDGKIAAAKAETLAADQVVDIEAAKAEAVKAAVAEVEANLDEYASNLEKALYEKYADQIIDVIDQRIETALAGYEPAEATEMSEEEYNAIRQQTRESEINGLLQQLQNNN